MGQVTELIRVRDFPNSASIEIDNYEMRELRESQNNLRLLQDIDELFIVAHETYIELEEELSRILIFGFSKPERDIRTSASNDKVRINIRLLAVLNAVKCYTDQTQQIVSELFPNDNKGARFWGESLAKIRDGSVDYRIMELVRNSAQHHALPISHSKSSIKNHRGESFPSQEVAIGFFLSRSDVHAMQPQNKKDKKTKTELLNENHKDFDLILLTRSYMQSICQLNNILSDFTEKVFKHSCQVLYDLHEDMREKLCIDQVNPIAGENEYLHSSSSLEFLKSRRDQARKRYVNKQMARLSYFPSDQETYPSV